MTPWRSGCRRKPGVAMVMIAALVLAACGRRAPPTPTRPRAIAAPSERETRACFADLSAMGVRFSPMVDRDVGTGCGWVGAVQLVDIGVPVTNLTAIRCGEARAFAGWVRNAVAPGAYQILGSELVRVEGMGSYSCRNVIGSAANAGRRSGHAIANAIDIGGFVLRDGRRVTILRDWSSPDPAIRQFLAAVHASACKRFGTVLSPAYNAAHANHLHLEDDHAGMCR